MTFAFKLVILCILTIILSFVFCKCSSKSFQSTFCRLYDAFNEFSINFIFFITIVIDNEIYLYEMLITNLLQAMLVRRAKQSHQHQQSSNSALLTCWAHTQSKSEAMTTRSLMRWSLHIHRMTATSLHTCCSSYTTHTQNDSNVFAYMLQFIYDTYTYTAKAWLSFCAHTDRRNAVNRSIFRIFRPIYTQRNHTQSSNSALFTRWAHIQHTHIIVPRCHLLK